MRIVHVYKDYFPVLGGIENHVRDLAEAQVAAGHDVTVLACAVGRSGERERLGGVQVVKAGRLATAASMPLSAALPLELRRARADVVHVHSPFPLGELANLLVGRGAATVITHHADVVRQKRLLRIYGPVLRRVLAAADAVIATNPRMVETSPWLGPVRDRCRVVPLGIDLGRWPDRPREGRSGTTLRLLTVGLLRHYKGIHVLLRTMSDLVEARLDVVGEGPMRPAWEALARDLGIGARVRFHGRIADDALHARYADADVFLLPSTSKAEAFGTVLLEAMAAGLPCVSTDLGTGTSWVNQDRITGLVVPPDDREALASALRALADPALRARLGRAGRRRVEDEFTLGRMVAGVEVVYKEALSRRGHAEAVSP